MACISLSWIIRFSDESVKIVEILFESSYNRIYIFSKESGRNFGSHAKSVWFELKIKKKREKEEGKKRRREEMEIGSVYFHQPPATRLIRFNWRAPNIIPTFFNSA